MAKQTLLFFVAMALVFYSIPIGIVAHKGTATYYTSPYVRKSHDPLAYIYTHTHMRNLSHNTRGIK